MTMTSPEAPQPTPAALRETPRFDAVREDRLRGLRLEFALGRESAKHFDVDEMRTLRDDLIAMLAEIDELRTERRLLAMLAAETPQFNNPLIAWEAQSVRDRVLKEERHHV